ncbi:nucleotidyltransferase [Snodgrassella alvi]|uniref:Nucleotidyltransferase n=2 Tax=Snodgrassella alvi TaxID=1196083 RepID=A0A2N9XI02_9NEIS|nr:nucleotidyltransferase [Snodgrassella alvi]
MNITDLKAQNLILLEVISGSRAFGLATETSDTDIKGVFYLPKDKFYGLHYIPQISNASNDIVYYEIGRFTELLLKNNPNIIEVLASAPECILYQHPLMRQFSLKQFLSKQIQQTFINYACSQIKKAKGLNKKINNPVDSKRKTVFDFCHIIDQQHTYPLNNWLQQRQWQQHQCGLANIPHATDLYALYYDENGNKGYRGIMQHENANDICLSSISPTDPFIAYLSFNRNGYSTYCREYKSYWQWVEKRNEQRYLTNSQSGQDYDTKNMMHTIRLLQVALEIISHGTVTNKRPNRQELLDIKHGKFSYTENLHKVDSLLSQITEASKTSSLPEEPATAEVMRTLINIRQTLYNNHQTGSTPFTGNQPD